MYNYVQNRGESAIVLFLVAFANKFVCVSDVIKVSWERYVLLLMSSVHHTSLNT